MVKLSLHTTSYIRFRFSLLDVENGYKSTNERYNKVIIFFRHRSTFSLAPYEILIKSGGSEAGDMRRCGCCGSLTESYCISFSAPLPLLILLLLWGAIKLVSFVCRVWTTFFLISGNECWWTPEVDSNRQQMVMILRPRVMAVMAEAENKLYSVYLNKNFPGGVDALEISEDSQVVTFKSLEMSRHGDLYRE